MNYRPVLKFIIVYEPHMPKFYGRRIPQGIFHIFNHLFCFFLCIVPFQLDSIFLSGIVLNILKEMQKAVAICAAVIHGVMSKVSFKWRSPNG